MQYWEEAHGVQTGGPAPSRLSAERLFWWIQLALVVAWLVLCPVAVQVIRQGADVAGLVLELSVVLLIFWPGIQLGEALLIGLILAVSARPDRSAQLWQLGKIVLGVVAGTLLGGLVMAALLFGLGG
jgi:hypothetical protein